jgi:regulator of cell morphogenesis and NO signaling
MSAQTEMLEDLRSLIAYILDKHHDYLRRELPRLEAIIAKMIANHGQERPELFQIQRVLQDLQDDISVHLMKEEQVLFPYIAGLEREMETGEPGQPPCFSSVQYPIRVMRREHDQALSLLKELRSATANYTPPNGTTCDCAVSFYSGLADLEANLLEHIRIENEQLFPQAISLEAQCTACP